MLTLLTVIQRIAERGAGVTFAQKNIFVKYLMKNSINIE